MVFPAVALLSLVQFVMLCLVGKKMEEKGKRMVKSSPRAEKN